MRNRIVIRTFIFLRATRLAFTMPGQLYAVADANVAAPDHVTIQGKCALESPHDVCT
jgi:hypothetical protein